MKLLVTGAGGQLGRELVDRAPARGAAVTALDRSELDITKPAAMSAHLARERYDAVINAAAYTNVDGAETDQAAAFAVNRDAVENLALACARNGTLMVHVSTDYVFDGQSQTPYREDDPTAPIGVYGASKLAGEHALQAALERFVIVRTSWVFSAYGHNFFKTILRLAQERERLTIVADQYGGPTYAGHLADLLLGLSHRVFSSDSVYGIYHFCGTPICSWYEFAVEICAQARKQQRSLQVEEIAPVTSAEFPTVARRPQNSALNCSKLRALGFEIPAWNSGVSEALNAL